MAKEARELGVGGGVAGSSVKILVDAAVGEGNGTQLQYYCLEGPMDGGAW